MDCQGRMLLIGRAILLDTWRFPHTAVGPHQWLPPFCSTWPSLLSHRAVALGVLLDAAVAEDAAVHSKAIRLLANRLFAQPVATAQVEAFARSQLDLLLPPPPAGGGAAAAAQAAPAAAAAVSGAAPPEVEAEPGAAGSSAARAAQATRPSAAAPAGQSAAQPVAAGGSDATNSGGGGGGGSGQFEGEVLAASRRCGLYCALCTKRHSLLPRLLEVWFSIVQNQGALLSQHLLTTLLRVGSATSRHLSQ